LRNAQALPQAQASNFGLEAFAATPSPFESLRSGSAPVFSKESVSLVNRPSNSPTLTYSRPPSLNTQPANLSFDLFKYPPPPLTSTDPNPTTTPVKNDFFSGNTFFPNDRANFTQQNFFPVPSVATDPMIKRSYDRILDEAKRKWPNLSESKIVEGLKKVKKAFPNLNC